jgi:hypothetical protein
MSASRFPWSVLGLAPAATEKEVRRAYATKLKQLDTAKDPEAFRELRSAYEVALMERRMFDADLESEPETVETVPDDPGRPGEPEVRDADLALAPPLDPTVPFKTMQSLVEDWDYSLAPWQQLLNDPLLDDRDASAAFEYALVASLSENELKTEYTLSAGKDWQDLIESRYGWVSDGIRYARLFPVHSELRRALVQLGRPHRPKPYSSVREPSQFTGLGKVGLALFVLWILIQIFNRAAQSGVAP